MLCRCALPRRVLCRLSAGALCCAPQVYPRKVYPTYFSDRSPYYISESESSRALLLQRGSSRSRGEEGTGPGRGLSLRPPPWLSLTTLHSPPSWEPQG